MNQRLRSERWFQNRIGERVFRKGGDPNCCSVCRYVLKNGLIIHDEMQASYLKSCQDEMELYYSDKKT